MGDPAAGGDVLEGGGPPRLRPPRSRRLGPFRLGPIRLGPIRLGPVRLGPFQLGPVRLGPLRLGPRGRWVAGLAGGLAAVVVVALLQRNTPPPVPVAGPSPSVAVVAPEPIAVPEPVPTASPPPLPRTGRTTGPGFLDPAARWELFARADTEVARIQPRLARVTRTAVPRLLSTGPVSFLAAADRALIRPLDLVPGVEVPDGRPARALPPRLGSYGPALPGPDPRHIWVSSGSELVLRPVDGGPDVARTRLPADSPPQVVVGDGAGRLLVAGTSGVYEVRPDGLHRLSPGALLAVGPRGWLVAECNDRHRCRSELIDRATGTRRDVGPPLSVGPVEGAISPDGATVALYRIEDGGHVDLDLLDIASGAVHAADLELEQPVRPGMLAWAPDGRLFAIAAGGAVRMIDRDSGRAGPIGPPLPPVRQLAVRTTA